MPTRPLLLFAIALTLATVAFSPRLPARETMTEADTSRALANLKSMDLPEVAARIDGLQARMERGTLSENDLNLLCIGGLSVPFAVAFGIGLVPNPPWDYLLGQLPAYAANLGLKFCPPVLEPPADIEVFPNVDTGAGPECAYDFVQPVIAGRREDFLGVPLLSLGDWTPGEAPGSRGFGTPDVFHYNSPVAVQMLFPGETPPGFALNTPDPQFVAEVGPFGIKAPDNDVFDTAGCRLDGSVPLSNSGGPCPVDLGRTRRLGVGSHTVLWRAETEIELMDVLPPIYVPTKPPGSKKVVAKRILKRAYKEVRKNVKGVFDESYPTGAVNVRQQTVRVLDTTAPSIGFAGTGLSTFRVEAQEPGGQSTRSLRGALRDTIVASDACNRTVQVSAALPPFLPLGTHPVTWTARDAGPAPGGGVNASTLVQTVVVEDTRPPQIAPPPSVVVETDSAPVFVDTGSPQVFDVVDLEPVVDFDGPDTFPLGVTTVRWRATDASGNASPWVDQTINVKLVGTNNAPEADDVTATGPSFEEITVPLSASDADADELYFYIDRQPDEGFFVAPLLPTFVDDLRVQAQADPGSICQSGGTLPPQDYVYDPRYVTTNDDGITYVIDRIVECDSNSSTGISTNNVRIARFGADGELLAEIDLGSSQVDTLAFHPGGLPGYPEPFIYWVSPNTDRLIVLDEMLAGGIEVIVIDFLPSGTPAQGAPVDAAIDADGILYVTDSSRLYAFDFLRRGSSNSAVFLDRIGAPLNSGTGSYDEAWDLDVDSAGNVYVVDWGADRIHKFGASTIDRNGSIPQFSAGQAIGWLGRCDSDLAPGDAAACDVARGRSIGYSCTDATCGWTRTDGDQPGQFSRPQGFAIDPNDILYIADRGNQRVQRFTPEGFFAGQATSDCQSVNCFVIGQFGVADSVSVNSTSFYVLDPDTDILHIFSADPVTMTGPDTGFVTYRSNNNYIGIDTFDWFASDGLRVDGELVRSNVATASIEVDRNQRIPFATAGISAQVLEDQASAILLDGSDPDIGETYPWEPLQTLSGVLISPPAHGRVSISGLTATYVPDPDYNGPDAFEFAVSDGLDVSAPERVQVVVLPVNDAPVLTPTTNPEERLAGIGYPWELNVGVVDPDPGDAHELFVDWGDGVQEAEGEVLDDGTVTGPLLDFNAGGEGVVHARHVYSAAAARTVRVCVTDLSSAERCADVAIDVVPMTDLALFESRPRRAVPVGQPVRYEIGMSNLQGEGGAGIPATGVTLEIELDPRLSVLGISGASCVADGTRRVCAIPDLVPIARGASNGTPPVDRQVIVTGQVDPAFGPGTRLGSRATLFADSINRSPIVRADLERVLVAAGDFTADAVQDDTPAANPGDGNCADADGRCTLRAAIDEANALGGARVIALPDALFRLDQGPLTVSAQVTLIGVGAGRSEIAAVGDQRLFDVAPGARLQLIGVTLSGDEPTVARGGLVHNEGELVIEDALLQNGDATAGGAVYSSGLLTVRRSIFSGNRALDGGGSGGAIFNHGDALIENALFHTNEAMSGGAVTSSPSTGATLTLRHVSITGNRARSVGAGLFGDFSAQPMATLERTLLAGNSSVQPAFPSCWNQLASAGGNLIADDREGCPFVPGPGDLVDVDPLLEPAVTLADGRIVLEPRAESPAVDALAAPCIAGDLRGLARAQGAGCDIGAFERGVAAAASVSPARIDFGPLAPGDISAPRVLTVASTGNLPLSVSALSEPEAPFMRSGGDCPLAPFDLAAGQSCSVQVRFVPVDAGPEIKLIEIGAEIESALFAVELWGNVTRPIAAFDPGRVTFGDVGPGQPGVTAAVGLSNSGDFDLNVDALTVTGAAMADFIVVATQDGCTGAALPPGSACSFELRFQPTEPGVRRATLWLQSNEPDGPRRLELLGTRDVVFFAGFESS